MLYLCSCRSSTVLSTKNPWARLYEISEIVHPSPGHVYLFNAGIPFFRLSTPCVQDPSHDGAGSLSKLLACGFDATFSAICFTASATARRIAAFSEVFCDADSRVLSSFL